MKRVLADTGPLYALVDSGDGLHVRARGELKRLQREGLGVVVVVPIWLESYTLVMRRMGTSVALRWSAELERGAGTLNPKREDYSEASRRLQRFPDQSITLFDAVLAVVSQQLRWPIWTFDHHFDVLEAAVWR